MPKDEFDPEDPLEFRGIAFPGDTRESMVKCFIEEFALLGHSEEEILRLFHHPHYRATHAYLEEFGEEKVRTLIGEVRDRWHGARVDRDQDDEEGEDR